MLQAKQEENVQQYLEKENFKLYRQEFVLSKKISYLSCNHIWVNSLITDDGDYHRFNSRIYCGCIKCGLVQSVFHLVSTSGVDSLSFTEKVMYDFMKENSEFLTRYSADLSCDFELGKAILKKIKDVHPDIDDETARKYFEIAFDNIRNIPVSDERKAKRAKRLSLNSTLRAKRLSLNSTFNQWPK